MRFYKVMFVPNRWVKLLTHVACAAAGGAVVAAGNAASAAIANFGLDPVYALAIGAIIGDVVRQLTLEISAYDPGDAWGDSSLPEA